jgi:5-methyltetrahydropteroyltriglutamate--homocysteine methyltransferase
MRHSTDRILTTHVGSLPRPDDLVELLGKQDRGEPVDAAALQARAAQAVDEVVAQQVANGVDIVCDGEMSKMSYHVYAKHRLTGLESVEPADFPRPPMPRDFEDFPEMLAIPPGGGGPELLKPTVCTGDVAYADMAPLERDIANLKAAAARSKPTDLFMNSASPGCLSVYMPNVHYPSRDAYREALIEAMRPEYNAIHEAGFVLQLDCPDMAGGCHAQLRDLGEAEFLKDIEKSVEALNEATRDIPPEAMRMHICWLNYSGPHTHDIPAKKLFGALAKARPQGILFEGANPRHAHEWVDWNAADILEDKILIPGVIDSTNNFVEHPELIAQRICQFADAVGRERVIAGSDCGFGTYAGRRGVFPSVVQAKFKAMAEGAEMASKRLW